MSNLIKQIHEHWAINGRPATERRIGNSWSGMPGGISPSPGNDYRLAIQWGSRAQIRYAEHWLESVQLRINFDGWNIGGKLRYRNSIQFFTDSTFSQPTSTGWRIHVDYQGAYFHPHQVGITEYAYFRVTNQRDRAWRMKYNIGLYGSLHQNMWKRVTAR